MVAKRVRWVRAMAATSVALAGPVLAASPQAAVRPSEAARLRVDPAQPMGGSALDVGRFSFTTPADLGTLRGPRPGAVERSFRFTPSGADRRALTVGISARTTGSGLEAASPAARAALAATPPTAPSGFNVGLALEWKGLAVSGGLARFHPGPGLDPSDEVGLGLSWGGRRWRTGVMASAERGAPLPWPGLRPEGDRHSLQASGSFLLSPTLSLSGGVRYRTSPGRLADPALRRDEEAIYLGGALAF
ncbi:MAG: hypothetical protein NZM40_08855 [Sphingomonadaceae bacterium]|uniref:hypothetical protein n=1 Tax=Thermaurantiacus sp. TaxID=2820283 RepID=UPI00298EE6BF|nr:hypothetical protein [Thermaurantiacus sp.]MCS6987517.1 hypothetical protein [Sphingomonadaceae bacterium]MDW8415118.1 hypothetical protein [Thermaurantiacus sp.]